MLYYQLDKKYYQESIQLIENGGLLPSPISNFQFCKETEIPWFEMLINPLKVAKLKDNAVGPCV